VTASAIQLEHLGKRYGHVTALRDLSLDVAAGEIFGFLGLNGAGKTTTIRILLDLVRPTTGRAAVFGLDCQARGLEVRAKLGYLPGEPGFYGDMTGEATLDLLAALSGDTVDRSRRTMLLDRLELAIADLRRPLRDYSTGMKRKLGIIQAFQADPPLLVLDEPTEGLDPLMQDAFYGLLADARGRGRTVFMSSHVLPEVERVCDRIGLVRGGELVLVSTVHEIRSLAGRRVRVSFAQPVAAPAVWPDGCDVIDVSPRTWDLRVHGALGAVVAMLASLPIADLEVQMPHLEEILKTYYADGGEAGDLRSALPSGARRPFGSSGRAPWS
jgi:ABC-2 type transport system ATP-binding protein